jgi:hypothetical protein
LGQSGNEQRSCLRSAEVEWAFDFLMTVELDVPKGNREQEMEEIDFKGFAS